jgi:hypothetical protein
VSRPDPRGLFVAVSRKDRWVFALTRDPGKLEPAGVAERFREGAGTARRRRDASGHATRRNRDERSDPRRLRPRVEARLGLRGWADATLLHLWLREGDAMVLGLVTREDAVELDGGAPVGTAIDRDRNGV